MIVLTPRQLEVLARLAGPNEPTRAEVGHQMGIAERTVKEHIRTAHRRLDVRSTAGAWYALGWLRAPSPEDARAMGIDRRPTVDDWEFGVSAADAIYAADVLAGREPPR